MEEKMSPQSIDLLTDQAVELVAQWLTAAQTTETKSEQKLNARLATLIEDPDGVAFTMRFVDRVARHRSNKSAAIQLRRLVAEQKLPKFLSPVDRLLLQIGARLAPHLPGIVLPLARLRMRSLVGHLVVDAEPEAMRAHLEARSAEGYACNVNLLGEAVLGNQEATHRYQQTIDLINDPEVNYVSIKVSSVTSQINLWAFDHTLGRVKAQLREIYRQAAASQPPTFINLDMEEYRDLHLTVRAFTELLVEPELRSLDAGIVLQAYLPDTYAVLQNLTTWATQRKENGGGDIKIRLVKGANLAMEKVEAALHGWQPAPYASKVEVDANYKRCVDWVFHPERLDAVRIGLASHNLFDVAWAHLLAQERQVAHRIEFEMLQGMAPAQARQVQSDTDGLLLYTPVVGKTDFDVAISYLFRRLEENASADNFLRHLFTLHPKSPEFAQQAQLFRQAVNHRHQVGSVPRRDAIPTSTEGSAFVNQPDLDPAMPTTQKWLQQLEDQQPQPVQAPVTTSLEQISAVVASAKNAQKAWTQRPLKERQNILRKVAEELLARHAELIVTMAHEAEKTRAEADGEISEAIDFVRWYAQQSSELEQTDHARFTPLGVIAVIPPWNFPVAIPTGGVLAALAAGNGVIFKPAPETPRCAEVIAEACWAAGVPKELLQFVRTPDDQVGQHLVTTVDGVILTGGAETAELFRSWKPEIKLFAETSGKNALIVTPQADLDLAAADLVRSAFSHQGQKCSAASLGILVGSVATDQRFLRQIVDAAASLVLGPAHDPATTFAPLIAPAQGKLLKALTTLAPGEKWLLQPTALDDEGQRWTPGIKTGVTPGSAFHQTECFGPVLGLMAATDLGEAISWQNDVDYGLTGGIHSLDPTEIEQWLNQVEVGNAYVNRVITGAIVNRQPFGGWKRSAIGLGAKAGGTDYLLQLGTWQPIDASDLSAAIDDDQKWWEQHYRIDHDPTGLFCEANILRYLPHPDVLIRIAAGTKQPVIDRILAATDRCGVNPHLSHGDQTSDQEFAELLAGHRFGRLRIIGPVSPKIRQAAQAAEINIIDAPVTASGRLELRWYLREQAISRTLHRFGNLISASNE